jgi:hypothetical protein
VFGIGWEGSYLVAVGVLAVPTVLALLLGGGSAWITGLMCGADNRWSTSKMGVNPLDLGRVFRSDLDSGPHQRTRAGDDLMYDVRGRALNDRLGPRLRAALEDRRACHDKPSGWPPSGVEFGCDYCADEHNFHYGHVTQIGSSGARRRILIQCPRCGTLYENTANGPDDIQRLTPQQARQRFGEPT